MTDINYKRPNQYISEYTNGNSDGWLVKFGKHKNNNTYLVWKAFYYSRGEKRKTLLKAKAFRDSEIKRLNYPVDGRGKIGYGDYSNDIGLSVVLGNKGKHYFWQASYRGKLKTFAITCYGYRAAYQKARKWRAEQTGEKLKRKAAPKPVKKALIKWLDDREIKY